MSIRKLTIGPDYKSGMHYVVGMKVMKGYEISSIILNKGEYEVWITNSHNETALYKSFTKDMPVSVEYNVDHFLEAKP